MYLLQESLPPGVQRSTLPCVWPMALSSSKRSEVNAWFGKRLHNYLVFLTKSLISPKHTYNASCLAFQKLYVWFTQHSAVCMSKIYNNISLMFFSLFYIRCFGYILFCSVSVLGKYNYTAADFIRRDVFNTIRTYLTSGQYIEWVSLNEHISLIT